MDNKSPISGDVRWVPMYWSTRQNPTGVDKNTVWRIGSPKGIREKKPTISIFSLRNRFIMEKAGKILMLFNL